VTGTGVTGVQGVTGSGGALTIDQSLQNPASVLGTIYPFVSQTVTNMTLTIPTGYSLLATSAFAVGATGTIVIDGALVIVG